MSSKHLCLVAIILMLGSGCAQRMDQTLTINDDGSARWTQAMVLDRAPFAAQMEMAASGDNIAIPAESTATTASDTPIPAQWTAVLAHVMPNIAESMGLSEDAFAITVHDLNDDTVTVHIQIDLPDLASVLRLMTMHHLDGIQTVTLQHEEEDPQRLRLVIGRNPEMGQLMVAQMQNQAPNLQLTLTLVLPGMIHEHPGWEIDADDPTRITYSIDLAMPDDQTRLLERYASDGHIVFDRGSLPTDDFPLEGVQNIQRLGPVAEEEPAENVDMAPGDPAEAMAQAQVVTITTQVDFPEGPALREAFGRTYRHTEVGLQVSGDLFPSGNRALVGLLSARAIAGIDDQDRPIPVDREAAGMRTVHHSHSSNDDITARSLRFTLDLPPQAPEIEAIEELQAEATLLTAERWHSHEINLADFTATSEARTVDLSTYAPGSLVEITRVERQEDGEYHVDIVLRGGPELEYWRVVLGFSGTSQGVHSYQRRSSTSNRGRRNMERSHTLVARFRGGRDEPASDPGDLIMTIHIPTGLLRERVAFTLMALDL